LIPVTAYKRGIQRDLDQASKQLFAIVTKISEAKLALGQLCGVACQICKKTIPYSGRKRPLFCWECQRNRKKIYLHNWRSENADHVRDYLRRHRAGLPPLLRRYKLRKGRGLPPGDDDYEALHGEGTAHYAGERTRTEE